MEWNCSRFHDTDGTPFVSHANAALTPHARLQVAQLVVDQQVPIAEVAARFQVCWPTVKRWAVRYAAQQPMTDRSSRPHQMHAITPPVITKRIVSLRLRHRLGPVQLAPLVGVAPSTVHRVLVRCRLNRLAHVDRATGEPVRRYEHDRPGAMLHVDVKKYGNIPDGGGWRFVSRVQGKQNRAATRGKARSIHHCPKLGHAFVHTVLDQRSRVAYAEVHDDETPPPACSAEPSPGSPSAGSPPSGSCPTTGRPTARSCGATCAASSASSTPAPSTTGHRPTARSNASTGPCPTAGATPAVTNQSANAATPCQDGSTGTTTPAPHRLREQATRHPVDQPPGSVQLGRSRHSLTPWLEPDTLSA